MVPAGTFLSSQRQILDVLLSLYQKLKNRIMPDFPILNNSSRTSTDFLKWEIRFQKKKKKRVEQVVCY